MHENKINNKIKNKKEPAITLATMCGQQRSDTKVAGYGNTTAFIDTYSHIHVRTHAEKRTKYENAPVLTGSLKAYEFRKVPGQLRFGDEYDDVVRGSSLK